jgi:peptidoglycan pentaglycine glycine transferase (the first glycine)
MEVKQLQNKNEWEKFMEATKPHTFLHSWAWGECNEKMGNKIFRLGVFEGEQLLMAALIFKVQAKRGSFLFCPHGPIFQENTAKKEALAILTDHLRTLAKAEKCSFIRISPLLQNTPEHQAIFHDLKFREAPIHMHSELAWILDVTLSEEELLKSMRKTTRYSIKKAEKDGVEMIVSSNPEDIDIFWKVYAQTVDRQNFSPFSKNYLRTEFEIFQKDDNARFFFAKYQNEIVAAALIIFYKNSAFYHHGASTHPKVPAPYLLQWQIIKEAKKRGFQWYDFWGIAPEDKPKHPWAGLSLFKKGFGGSSTPYVHAKDLVLSPMYWISWLIETVRRIKRGL